MVIFIVIIDNTTNTYHDFVFQHLNIMGLVDEIWNENHLKNEVSIIISSLHCSFDVVLPTV